VDACRRRPAVSRSRGEGGRERGRGVGSAEGFRPIEELAGLLGAAVGCFARRDDLRLAFSHSQVGQTGTKISPILYVACGISGATQHLAGCKGARRFS